MLLTAAGERRYLKSAVSYRECWRYEAAENLLPGFRLFCFFSGPSWSSMVSIAQVLTSGTGERSLRGLRPQLLRVLSQFVVRRSARLRGLSYAKCGGVYAGVRVSRS